MEVRNKLCSEVKACLLNFAVTELSKSVKSHVYEFAKSEIELSRHVILSSVVAASQTVSNVSDSQVALGHSGGDGLGTEQETQSETVNSNQQLNSDCFISLLAASDSEYERVFRMNRTTMDKLIHAVDKRVIKYPDLRRQSNTSIPTATKVMLTAWLMGNNMSFKKASVVFEMAKITVYRVFHEVCSTLTVLAGKYIRWPTSEQSSEIVTNFLTSFSFPGVIGVLGCCHIHIREPENKTEAQSFLKDDKHHSVILQAVVDNNLLFRDVCAGFPGRTPITHVLVGSPLYKHLSNETYIIQPSDHLLGNFEYPQLPNLLTPYTIDTNNRPLTKEEEDFNNLHNLTCQVVDITFTVLKERFPRLNYLDVCRPELASKVIIAACVLHNFTILEKNEWYVVPSE